MPSPRAAQWQRMSTAPSDRLALFKVPLGDSEFFEPLVGRFDPFRGWVNTVQTLATEGRIFPTAWCEIPPFDDDATPSKDDERARICPLKKPRTD